MKTGNGIKLRKIRFCNLADIATCLLVIKTYLMYTRVVAFNGLVDSIMTVGAIFLFLINILEKKYSFRRLFLYLLLTLLVLLSGSKVGNYGFSISVITVMALDAKRLNNTIKNVYQLEIVLFFLTVSLSILQYLMLGTPIYLIDMGRGRYYLGFTHPNVLSAFLFNIMLLWVWVNYDRITMKNVIVLGCVEMLGYYLTRTRTILIAYVVLAIMLMIKINDEKNKFTFRRISALVTPIIAAFTYLLCYGYLRGNLISIFMNLLLTTRVKLGAYALSNFGITFLGTNLSGFVMRWTSEWGLNDFTFDNIYTYLMFNQGIVWLALLCIAFFVLAFKENRKINTFIILWAIYGMTEVHGINCYLFCPLFILAFLFDNQDTMKFGMALKNKD